LALDTDDLVAFPAETTGWVGDVVAAAGEASSDPGVAVALSDEDPPQAAASKSSTATIAASTGILNLRSINRSLIDVSNISIQRSRSRKIPILAEVL
jgi:hypothetical protein